MLRWLYKLDPLYGLLLTFGLALIARRRVPHQFGVVRPAYDVPERCPAPPTSAS